MQRRSLIGSLGGICCGPALAVPDDDARPFVFAMSRFEWEFIGLWERLIWRDAFARLGREVRFVDYPAARARVELERGEVDGEGGRPLHYGDGSTNMLRLRVPLFDVTHVAFAPRAALPRISGWDSLKAFEGQVCYKAGVTAVSGRLAGLVPPDRMSPLADAAHGLRMLALRRCALYIDEETTILAALVDKTPAELPVAEAGVLGTSVVYGYVHRRHAALAERLGDVLAQMQARGLIERHRRDAEAQLRIDAARWRL